MPDPAIEAAIARGNAVAGRLIEQRDSLFKPFAAIYALAGPQGLRACVAGVAEAVIIAATRDQVGEGPLAEVIVDAERSPSSEQGPE